MRDTVCNLFGSELLVALGALWASITSFLFPTSFVGTSAIAVLIMMSLDLITKLFALAKMHGGFRKALRTQKINSRSFAKGTLDKLIIFGVFLIINGCACRLLVIEDISKWFTQAVFTIMFLRDTLSIFENLSDCGVQGLSVFKKLIKRKCKDIVDGKEE